MSRTRCRPPASRVAHKARAPPSARNQRLGRGSGGVSEADAGGGGGAVTTEWVKWMPDGVIRRRTAQLRRPPIPDDAEVWISVWIIALVLSAWAVVRLLLLLGNRSGKGRLPLCAFLLNAPIPGLGLTLLGKFGWGAVNLVVAIVYSFLAAAFASDWLPSIEDQPTIAHEVLALVTEVSLIFWLPNGAVAAGVALAPSRSTTP